MNREQRRRLSSPKGVRHHLERYGCDCDPKITPAEGMKYTFDILHRDGCTHGESIRPWVDLGYLPHIIVPVKGCAR